MKINRHLCIELIEIVSYQVLISNINHVKQFTVYMIENLYQTKSYGKVLQE